MKREQGAAWNSIGTGSGMRKLEPNDAPELARLIGIVWPDNNPTPERIARVSLESSHAALVETAGGRLVGFVDAFGTVARDGAVRWEIDLLGVHPDYRGRGMAQGLVRAAVEAGRAFGAVTARALVKVDNAASLNTFQRCGFVMGETVYDLCISDWAEPGAIQAPAGAHLISVCTLTYSGVWVEGEQSGESLRAGQAARTRHGWDVAGAVIPAGTHDAESRGYEVAGQYRWMERTL
jgi:ribosomal protein S18 acetylase RimI-like enzyme